MVAIAALCGSAPGVPIGGCDPPQPASNAAAAPAVKAWWANPEIPM